MSSLRDLVTGSDVCTPSGDGAGPSNAVGGLVNTLLGGASKTQEQLRELPQLPAGIHGPPRVGLVTPEQAAAAAAAGPSGMHVPGVLPSHHEGASTSRAHELLSSIAGPSSSQGAAWADAFSHAPGPLHRPHAPPFHAPPFHAGALAPPPPLHALHHPAAPQPPPPAIAQHLRTFFSGGGGRHAHPPPLPPGVVAGLSVADKCRIRDRATIMSRHVYAGQGDAYADEQVSRLLASLHINPAELPTHAPHVHDPKWHDAWAQAQQQGLQGPLAAELAAGARAANENWDQIWGAGGQQAEGPHQRARPLSTGWAAEFAQGAATAGGARPQGWAEDFLHQRHLQHAQHAQHAQQQQAPGHAWAEGFAAQHGPGHAWAEGFAAEQQPGHAWAEELSTSEASKARLRSVPDADALRSTRALADVLSQDTNPKMRNSKFLQFVSKMSRGEIAFEGNKVVDQPGAADQWAHQFSSQQQAEPPHEAWATEFASPRAAQATQQQQPQQQQQQQQQQHPQQWGDEFATQLAQGLDLGPDAELEQAWRAQAEAWQGAGTDVDGWAREFNAAGDEATFQEWERIYGLGEAHSVADGLMGPLRRKGEYVFAADNPFKGDAQAFAKGKDLFRRGVLNEAVLALEAEVTARPEHAEAWRLLGTVHAENDDDQQAIAAMMRALAASPASLDVRMALGVSHTNELDTGEAVGHVAAWLAGHPTHRELVQRMGGVSPPDSSQALSHVVRLFRAAAAEAPADAELQVALGVLHHLARQYDDAIGAFEAALRLVPQDYSLWNKLGATLANNSRSAEAIHSYQRALDLKPNYMRAWTNMGISFANVGEYEKSARYYVRALQLNPSAGHVWSYLRTSLSCAGLVELMGHVEAQNLEALGAALPLE